MKMLLVKYSRLVMFLVGLCLCEVLRMVVRLLLVGVVLVWLVYIRWMSMVLVFCN